MIIYTENENETEEAAAELACSIKPGTVIAMRGGLGAGKTAFIRGLARGLGLKDRVSSPTFTIVNEYTQGPVPLFHFDMYRLSGPDELFEIGWEDYLSRGGICAVEWSENVDGAFYDDTVWIDIEKISDSGRKISVEGVL